jgi:hypothetical protein
MYDARLLKDASPSPVKKGVDTKKAGYAKTHIRLKEEDEKR